MLKSSVANELKLYICALFRYDRGNFCALVGLTSALGFFEGVNIILIAPLLNLLGVGAAGSLSTGVEKAFAFAGVPLNIYSITFCYAAVIIAQSWLQRVQSVRLTILQRGFGRMLSNRLFAATAAARWSFWLKNRKSDVAHYLTDEVNRVITGTVFFVQIASAIMIVLVQVALAVKISPMMTLIAAISGLILYFAGTGTIRRSRLLGWNLSDVYRKFHAECQEYLGGIKEIKICNNTQRVVGDFAAVGAAVDDKLLRFSKAQNDAALISRLTSSLMVIVFLLLAVKAAGMTGEYVLIMLYIFSRIWPRFGVIQNNLHYVIMMLPSYTAINSYILSAEACDEGIWPSTGRQSSIGAGIELRNISFAYEKPVMVAGSNTVSVNGPKKVLDNISFFIKANTTVALVGESGSGKSTLADLLTGLHKPDEGEILIDGELLDESRVSGWRNSLAYVAQDAFLLNDSIHNNLKWACPAATAAEMEECLRAAQAWEFVSAMPQGMDSIIGDRGIKLSGGERQRLVLARALLRKPAFLLLDEATSALDNENEQKVKESLDELRGKLTVFVIAHRLSTIENADLIAVLHNGKIEECGTYKQLMTDNNSRLWQMAHPGR